MLATAFLRALVSLLPWISTSSRPFQSDTLRELSTAQVSQAPDIPRFDGTDTAPPVSKPLQISSSFGPRWKASQSRDDFHRGIDYFDDLDAPIYACQNGTVFQVHTEAAGSMPGGGNVLVLEHALSSTAKFHDRVINKYYSYYLHLNSIAALSEGDVVSKGTEIGTMGQTGETSFTHLHFETHLVGYCSYQFQFANNRQASPTSSCNTGFDPHVHPYLFVGGVASGPKYLYEVEPMEGFEYAVRYNATRGHMDMDVIRTSLGDVHIGTRHNVNINTIEALDDLHNITPWMALRPGYFVSTTEDTYAYELHFRSAPSFVEVYDIYGNGIRASMTADPGSQTSSATTEAANEAAEGTASAGEARRGGWLALFVLVGLST